MKKTLAIALALVCCLGLLAANLLALAAGRFLMKHISVGRNTRKRS